MIAIIAITTNSSISVKAFRPFLFFIAYPPVTCIIPVALCTTCFPQYPFPAEH